MIEGIGRASVWEVMGAPEFPALIEAYERECRIEGMPEPNAKLESYQAYDATGFLHVFAAVQDSALVGFITVLAPPLPHYSVPVAVCESFFVHPGHRGLTGLQLLATAEKQALACGSPGLLVCAPLGGRLAGLLPKVGYHPTNTIFFKRLGDVH